MKICLVARTLDLKRGGVARVALELLHELRRRGHQVDVVIGGDSSLYSYFVHTLFSSPLYLRNSRYDVYHAVTPLEAVWIPKEKGVVTFLDLFSITDREKCGAGMNSSWERRFAGSYFRWASLRALSCKRVACIGQHTKEQLRHLFPAQKEAKVIRLGISPSLTPLNNPWVLNPTYGYLGQLDRRKRADLLIRSFINSGYPGRLLIAGGGPEEESLKRISDDSRIQFLGVLREEELNGFYNMLDAFVFPTWVEGYGLPIVEAMACGKPVVALGDAVIPEELKSRCIVVDRLEDFFANPRSFPYDYEGNLGFARLHSWEKCVDEYTKLYEEVLGDY